MWLISYRAWSQMVDRKSKISFPMLGAISIFHRLFLKKLWNYWWIWILFSCNIAIWLFRSPFSGCPWGGRSLSFSSGRPWWFFTNLIITEPQVKVVESAVYLFRNGVFYHLTPQQRTLWKAIQDLPMDQDRKKRLHFDPTDQTKLSYSLKEFKKLGQITAPTSLFNPRFYSGISFWSCTGPDRFTGRGLSIPGPCSDHAWGTSQSSLFQWFR